MTEREIFAAALEQPTEAERQAFLNQTCDAEMRQRIERLLEQQAQLGSFLDHPPLESDAAALNGLDPTIVFGNGSTHDDDVSATNPERPDMRTTRQDPDDEIPLGYLQPSAQPNSLGRLGHYEVLEVVGRGAFGTVLRAFDEKLQRVVAIKVLAPEMAATSPARKRFLREARTSAAIRHENVVAIHAVEDDPIPYLVMEYIPGQTLQQRLDDRGPLAVQDVLKIGKQIADGLAAAHAQDLIHRDIKPGNILLEGGVSERVKITDFGLARTADDASMSQSGLIAGTPMYMAPEQAHGHKIDQRADLFSLGSVLYQMLSGRPPFRAATTFAVLKRVAEDSPRPIQEIIPEVPTWTCEMIGHLHAKNPDERYQSAKEVSDLLAKCLDELKAGRVPKIPRPSPGTAESAGHSPVSASKPDQPARQEMLRRSPLAKLAVAALVLLGVIGITEATGVTKLASTVVRLATGSGTLVVETDDPDVKIAINGEEVTIKGGGVEELTLRPGEYKVAALKDGHPVKQELVSITRNGRTVVRMSLETEPVVVDSTGIRPSAISNFALEFDGDEDYVATQIPHDGSTPLTVEATVQLSAWPEGKWPEKGSLREIISNTQNGGLGLYATAGGFHFHVHSGGTYFGVYAPRDDQLLNRPVVLAGILDGTVIRLFVDGKQVAERTMPNEFRPSQEFFTIGASPGNGKPFDGQDVEWRGLISRVRFSNIARYQFKYDVNTPLSADEHTLALYHFDEGSGDVLKDSSGNGHHGKIVGAKWVRADGLPVASSGNLPLASRFPPGSSADILTSDEYEWTKPELLPGGVNDPNYADEAPKLSRDGLTLLFSSQRPGGQGGYDIWMCQRSQASVFFGTAVNLGPTVNSALNEFNPCLSADGLALLFHRKVNDERGTDLFQCQRATLAEPFGAAQPLDSLNTNFGENDPWLSADGLTLYFASNRPGGEGDFDIWMCQRPSTASSWSNPINLGPSVNGPRRNGSPAFSDDGLTMLFTTLDSKGDTNIWMVTRASIRDPWNPPQHLTVANTPVEEFGCTMSADARTIIFARRDNRAVPFPNGSDLWIVNRVPKSKSFQWPADAPPPAIAPFNAAQAKKQQEAWAKYLGVPVEYTNSIGMKFRLIPPGEFPMGSTPEEIEAALTVAGDAQLWRKPIQSEAPQHKVILTQPLYVGVTEVTQSQYKQVMGANPSHFSANGKGKDAIAGLETGNHPVEMVSRNDAAEFCAKLSQQEQLKPFYFRSGESVTALVGTGYRLPTEAEWEFACRAGTTTRFWSGDEVNNLVRAAWFQMNSSGRTHAVGELEANPFGLHDVHGNVWEWVQDSFDPTFYGHFVKNAAVDPSSSFSADFPGLIRGGNWKDGSTSSRSSTRYADWSRQKYDSWGFRVVLSVDVVNPRPGTPPAATTSKVHQWPADAPPPAIAPFNAAQAKKQQEAWAKHFGVPVEYTNSIGMKFRLIPPGEFLMGSTPEEIEAALKVAGENQAWRERVNSETPRHKVILTQPVYVCVTEVTQTQYERVMGTNPSAFSTGGERKDAVAGLETGNHPVEMVSWYDAAEFCARLSQKEQFKPFYFRAGNRVTALRGTGYRIPTEAEWEHACRAGTTTWFSSGDEDQDLIQAGWFGRNSGGRTHAVGELSANPFGLSDVHGNVWEWVQDGWDPAFYGQFTENAAVNPSGPFPAVSWQVIRGGHWHCIPSDCHSSTRYAYDHPSFRGNNVGFRVVLPVDAIKQRPSAPPAATSSKAPFTDADVKRIAALPAAQQIEEVRQELIRRNPGFDGTMETKIEGDFVTEFRIVTDKVTDISPVRVFDDLQVLECVGSGNSSAGNGRLSDLRPLNEMDLRKLTRLNLSRTKVKSADLANLAKCPNLNELFLQGLQVDDQGLAHFKDCKNINTLWLTNTNLTDAGLAYFKDCNLTSLHLNGTSVSDEGLAHFKDCKRMAYLYLHKSRVTNAGLAHFQNCSELSVLYINDTKITDLTLLKKLPLKELSCDFKKERDAEILRSIKSLERINDKPAAEFWKEVEAGKYGLLPLANADVKRIAALPAAQQIEEVRKELVRRNPGFDGNVEHKIEDGIVTEIKVVTDQVTDIAPLRVFNSLVVLDLSGTETNDYRGKGQLADLSSLQGMNVTGLTELNLNWTKVSDAALVHFQESKNLAFLGLGETKVTDAGLAYFKGCKELMHLHLFHNPLSDAGLVHFKDCKNLIWLHLARTNVSDTGLGYFKDCTRLTSLTVHGSEQVSEAGLAHFKGCKDLSSLFISGTNVKDLSLLKNWPLKAVFVSFQADRDAAILRSITTLETINYKPTAEFWKEVEASQ